MKIPTKEEIYFKFFNEVVTEYNIDIEKVDFNIPYKIVKNLCDSLNIDLINLKEPFQIAKEQVFFNFDEHLNKNGHIEIANKIASKYANNDKINKLQNLPTYSRYPRYSNSTNTILFQSFIDGNSELFLHNSNGAINRLTHNNEDEGHAVFFNNDDDKFVITQGDVGNNYSKVVIWNSNSNERLLIGGDTLFASMEAAYDDLSERMKIYLDGLNATHSGEQIYRGRYNNQKHDDTNVTYPRNVHPVVRTHPVTGRKSIFVNKTFTTQINEIPKAESDSVLAFLYSHCAKPDYQVRFKWQPHSIAFWDNRCVQHLALWDYYPQVRSGYRVTVKGDKPF